MFWLNIATVKVKMKILIIISNNNITAPTCLWERRLCFGVYLKVMLRLASEASGSVTESGAIKSSLDSASGMNRNRNGDDSDHDTQSTGKRSIRRAWSLEQQCVIILSVCLALTPTKKLLFLKQLGLQTVEKHTSFPIKTRIRVWTELTRNINEHPQEQQLSRFPAEAETRHYW